MLSLLGALPGAVAQGLIWGIMAIGIYITFRILDFPDMTVDGSITTGAAVCVMLISAGQPVWLAMLAATGAGCLAGLVTGILHTFMGIPDILAGILTQLSLYSINLKIMGKANQALNVRQHKLLVSLQYNSGVPFYQNTLFIVAIALVILIGAMYWFFGTEKGASIRATGSNPKMSRAQGINTSANKVIALMISNGIVGLAGAFLAQYNGFSDVQMGRGAIVIGLAAIIIAEALFGKLVHNFALILGSVTVGAVIYFIVYQTVIWLGLDADLLKLLSAVVVAIFLAVPYWKKHYFGRKGGKKNA